MRKPSNSGIALITIGCIQIIFAVALFGICGTINNGPCQQGSGLFGQHGCEILKASFGSDPVISLNYGVAVSYLLMAILAIIASGTGHSCPSVTTAVISVFVILASLVAAIVSTAGLFPGSGLYYGNLFNRVPLLSGVISKTFGVDSSYQLRVGLVVVNWLSFCFLIILSCLACCGSRRRSPYNNVAGPITTVVTSVPPMQGGADPIYMVIPPENIHTPGQPYTPEQPYAAGQPYSVQMQQQYLQPTVPVPTAPSP